MPRPRRLMTRLALPAIPTDAQLAESLKDTKDILVRCRDLCRELDIPGSEISLVYSIFHEQLALQIQAAEEAQAKRAQSLILELRKKNVAAPAAEVPPFVGQRPRQPEYMPPGYGIGEYDGLDQLDPDEIVALAKQHGIAVPE